MIPGQRRTLIAGTIAVALSVPGAAHAQSATDTARADALFQAGKQLRDAGQWTDACPSFAESKRLAPGVGISLYLADCYEHTGRLSRAYKEFREAERLASERNDKRADTARARALALESKLGALVIALPSAAGREAPEVLLDGTRVPPEQWNVAMTVDPGDHVITINAPGQPPRTLNAHVDASYQATTVRVDESAPSPPPPPPAAPAPAAPAAEAAEAPVAAGGHSARIGTGVALTILGLGGLAIGTGLVATAPSPPPSCTPPPVDNSRMTAEEIAYAAGAAALVAGIVVLAVPGRKPATGALVTPIPLASGAGAMFRTAF